MSPSLCLDGARSRLCIPKSVVTPRNRPSAASSHPSRISGESKAPSPSARPSPAVAGRKRACCTCTWDRQSLTTVHLNLLTGLPSSLSSPTLALASLLLLSFTQPAFSRRLPPHRPALVSSCQRGLFACQGCLFGGFRKAFLGSQITEDLSRETLTTPTVQAQEQFHVNTSETEAAVC